MAVTPALTPRPPSHLSLFHRVGSFGRLDSRNKVKVVAESTIMTIEIPEIRLEAMRPHRLQ